jgi:putative nucleotidyltransferase with HDIG domain
MKLSELVNKEQLLRVPPKQEEPSPRPPPPPPPPLKPQPPPPVVERSAKSLPLAPQPPSTIPPRVVYDVAPRGIYQAAEQLEMPIPQNRNLILRNVNKCLHEVLAVETDPVAKKDDLWAKIWHVAADLASAVALYPDIDQNLYTARIENGLSRNGKNPTPAKTPLVEEPQKRLIEHSINSAIIAVRLIKEVGKAECSPQEICAAALVHDFGLVVLGLEPTREEDNPRFKEHVAKTVGLLEEMKAPEAIRRMVAQHHERTDGNGYPAGTENGNFLISSQVLALSETFDRILYDSYKKDTDREVDQENCVRATLDRFHMALDKNVLKAFISLRGFFPNGTIVELNNRTLAVVVKQNEGFPLRPIVQITLDSSGNHPDEKKIIDLRSMPALAILRSVTRERGGDSNS